MEFCDGIMIFLIFYLHFLVGIGKQFRTFAISDTPELLMNSLAVVPPRELPSDFSPEPVAQPLKPTPTATRPPCRYPTQLSEGLLFIKVYR